ncbi:MAG: hypothetical protein OEL89_00150 [Candidatus Peregrinibacteria bacterium]|nr:hypothetical protein [Candidatus Peregrinibacteria bacterium]
MKKMINKIKKEENKMTIFKKKPEKLDQTTREYIDAIEKVSQVTKALGDFLKGYPNYTRSPAFIKECEEFRKEVRNAWGL